jgi:integrase
MINFLFQPKRVGDKSRLWSARVRLDGWLKSRTFPLHVTDKRVAQQKLTKLVEELEREAAGIGAPRIEREAAQTPLLTHLQAFLSECESTGRSRNTLHKYSHSLPKLFGRCRWVTLRDVTEDSFTAWREKSGLSPKTLNDCLSNTGAFLNWMKRRRLIVANPLEHVRKVSNDSPGNFRRALSVDEINRLLKVAPTHRATVYQTILYTGLRRQEINGLRWVDFDFTVTPTRLKVPSSISKNRKESVHFLRPELTETLKAFRPDGVKPAAWAFRGKVPRVPTFKRDLAAAGIPFEDERGRRVDLHALRTTFGTLLSASGVSPRVAMELMRHSDLKLTMKVYTDASQLPLITEAARLPSFTLPWNNSKEHSQLHSHEAVVLGSEESPGVVTSRSVTSAQASEDVAFRHEKTAGVASSGFHKMERAKRLELSTSTLARWCSTN